MLGSPCGRFSAVRRLLLSLPAPTISSGKRRPVFTNYTDYLLITQLSVSVHSGQVSVEGFLEELVVRRELADNFCYYEQRSVVRGIAVDGSPTLWFPVW